MFNRLCWVQITQEASTYEPIIVRMAAEFCEKGIQPICLNKVAYCPNDKVIYIAAIKRNKVRTLMRMYRIMQKSYHFEVKVS